MTDARPPRRLLQLLAPFLGLLAVLALFGALAPASFLTIYNFKTVAAQTVIVGLGAAGMTFVIVSGGIDLSIGSVIALSSVVCAWLLRAGAAEGVAVLGGVATGAVCGALNGLMITRLRVVPFIVTLGMLGMARGAAKALAAEQKIDAPAGWLQGLMSKSPAQELLGMGPVIWLTLAVIVALAWIPLRPWLRFQLMAGFSGVLLFTGKWLAVWLALWNDAVLGWFGWQAPEIPNWFLLPLGVWIMLLLAAGMAFVLRRTVFGTWCFAIGSNEATARLCGVPVAATKVWIYALCGLFAGLAGVLQFGRLTVGDPTTAMGKELDIIAAVVIGGASLSGGTGSILGALIGAFLMSFLANGCNLTGVPNYAQEILIGAIIVAAVTIDRLRSGRNR